MRRVADRDDWLFRLMLVVLSGWLAATFLLPLLSLLARSFRDESGAFVGLQNYAIYFATPALYSSLANSLAVALLTTAITIPLAFVYAYALTRTCMHGKGIFRALALIPILAPSLLPGLSFIYMFGNQGVFKGLLGGASIYGFPGIVLAEAFFCFPHALIILIASLSLADARLYEAARSLRAGQARMFLTVTLPGVKYGLINAAFIVATLSVTDFGIPKVLGGNFNVLATDVYKQVVGQQNLEMGAVVGVVLLVPVVFAFGAERFARRREVALLSGRAVPLEPRPQPILDWLMFAICGVLAVLITSVLGFAVWGSLIKYWPYNLSLTLKNYNFSEYGAGGWSPYLNSVYMSALTAVAGTVIVFIGAYVLEKTKGLDGWRQLLQFVCIMPLAVPGLVLGLAYLIFFNNPHNPGVFLYGTLTILVINTIAHFYTVPHLTAVTALRQLDSEFESVSASLKVPLYVTFFRVTVPVCLPAILDVSIYFFLNAMTTVSAVIFLYSIDTRVASVTIVNMFDFGFTAPAAAMSVMIVLTSGIVRLAHFLLTRRLVRRTQAWRSRNA